MSAYDPSSPRQPAAEACALLRDALLPALRLTCLAVELSGKAPEAPPDGLVFLAEHILERLRAGLS